MMGAWYGFKREKYLFLLPLGWVTPVDNGVWTSGHAQISGTGVPPRFRGCTNRKELIREPKGGGSGDAMHSCDEPKIDGEDFPSLKLTTSSPLKKWMGLEDDPASFWGLVYFQVQVLLLLVSGRVTPWKLNSSPLKIYIPSPKRRGKRLPVPSIFSRSFFAVQLPEGTRKKTRW